MSHERFQDSSAAFVLGALPELECELFERHLMGCEDCRGLVEQLRPAAEALSRAVEPHDPSPRLKESLMAVVEADVREREAAERADLPERRRLRLPGVRWPGLHPRPALAWASAVVLITFGLAGGFALDRLTEADGTRTVAATVDAERLPAASGSLLVPRNDGKGAILRVHGLPDPPPNQVYQVWLDRRGEVSPVSLFAVTTAGTGAAAIPDDLEDVDAVLVTRERDGGADAPTERPVMRVDLARG